MKLRKSQEVHHRIIQKQSHDKEIPKERYISP